MKRNRLLTVFEILMMIGMFFNLVFMVRFLPNSIAEWGLVFSFWVYVFYELWSDWYNGWRKR